jgi:hypothetical protein
MSDPVQEETLEGQATSAMDVEKTGEDRRSSDSDSSGTYTSVMVSTFMSLNLELRFTDLNVLQVSGGEMENSLGTGGQNSSHLVSIEAITLLASFLVL